MSKSNARLKKTHRDFAAMANKKVGARVAERRVLAGLSQTDLGMPMGVSMQQAQRYEAGESGMDVATLISMSRTLGCTVADFLVDFDPSAKGTPPALSPDAMAIAKGVDGIKSGGLRGIVKLLVEKLRAHERAAGG